MTKLKKPRRRRRTHLRTRRDELIRILVDAAGNFNYLDAHNNPAWNRKVQRPQSDQEEVRIVWRADDPRAGFGIVFAGDSPCDGVSFPSQHGTAIGVVPLGTGSAIYKYSVVYFSNGTVLIDDPHIIIT